MKRIILSLLLAFPVLMAPAADLHAATDVYVRTISRTGTPLFWPTRDLKLEVLIGQTPAFLSTDMITTAMRSAVEAWTLANDDRGIRCADMQISVLPSLASTFAISKDGVMTVQFRTDTWSRNALNEQDREIYPREALAITTVFSSPSTGRIVNTHIEINAVPGIGYQWSDLVANPDLGRSASLHDLQNTLTHEMGHVMGFDHTCRSAGQPGLVDQDNLPVPSCNDAAAYTKDTTMFAEVVPGDIERRTLSRGDRLGMCAVYPGNGATVGPGAAESDSQGGCAIASTNSRNPGPVWIVGPVFGMLALLGRRRRVTAP